MLEMTTENFARLLRGLTIAVGKQEPLQFCTCTHARVMGSYSESEKASQHREMPSNAVAALLLSGRDRPF
jgi:hypothetical protein